VDWIVCQAISNLLALHSFFEAAVNRNLMIEMTHYHHLLIAGASSYWQRKEILRQCFWQFRSCILTIRYVHI
jgi:hypothetical protein